jgi:hypothetical protein
MLRSFHVANRNMKDVGAIIDAFGGNAAMARIIEKGASTVSEMRRRGSIPIEYWPALVKAAADADIAARDKREVFELTNDVLVEAHLPPTDEATLSNHTGSPSAAHSASAA